MAHDILPQMPLAAAGLAVVGLASLPGLSAIASQIRNKTPKDNFYEDIDGKSTPEALAAFSNKASKAAILILSINGFALSIPTSILATIHSPSSTNFTIANWLATASWAFLLAQAACLAAHHSCVKVYQLGLWASASSLVTAAITVVQALEDTASHWGTSILRVLGALTAVLLFLACLLIPRRPDVFFHGKVVDNHRSTTALSRVTWSWASSLLNLASKNGDLGHGDMPYPDHNNRADHLVAVWQQLNLKSSLLRSLLWAYRHRIAIQFIGAPLKAVVSFTPYYVMLRLIRFLEQRSPGDPPTPELWAYVFLLGFCTLIDQWIEGWTNWFSLHMLAFPVRGQLSAIIFEKSLRRKIVRGAEQTKDTTTASNTEDGGDKAQDDDDKKESDDDASVLKSQQAIVNLVGVDTKRISNFAFLQTLIISGIVKLVVSGTFLVNLIGWLPAGAGLLAWALVLPINSWATKYYMGASQKLMKSRDDKLAVVNEALLGMRQIKFSALEKQWERRILDMREKEIAMIKRSFVGDTLLFTCWVFSPILIAAASLATYAVTQGGLSPSIAFVSIGIFKSLEITLGALPELVSSGADTFVSIKRIDEYLKGPEMKKITSDGPEVSFEAASVAWPVDKETPDEDRFILSNLNLSFPKGQLSVISGKTGTGKSLLLSAILGEVDLLKGAIRVPPSVSPVDRRDAEAHPGNWILPGSVAYVSQTPWLESTSLRNNILFGLPFIEERYYKVLDACALEKDIQILPDGDRTELGANGVNLSGGQKWRVTLARAIYSRAEILVMDDIFSAVDAHVGRQIFEKCIIGNICRNRTRILVTHHIALVQSKARYLVELGEGTVLRAGLVSELAKDGSLEAIKADQEDEAEIREDEAAEASTVVGSEEVSVTGTAERTESSETATNATTKDAKQFIKEETREKGMVKGHVYAVYLQKTGGWFFWIICAFFFIAFEACNLGRGWWLRIWTGQGETSSLTVNTHDEHPLSYLYTLQNNPAHAALTPMAVAAPKHSLSFYLGVYIAIAGLSGVVGTMRFLWYYIMSLKASRSMFENILYAVLRTPLRWIDTVPVGRILNRLTADFDVIDSQLTTSVGMVIWNVLGILGVCVAAALVSPYILPLGAVLFTVAAVVGKKYMDAARPLKRLESTAKSPVFDLFNAALSGLSTLRAYHKTGAYTDRMHLLLDSWDVVSVIMWLFNRWMGFRMSVIGTVFTTCVGIVILLSPSVDAAMAGFTLSFALDFASNVLYGIRSYAQLELNMNSTERVIEYMELETESQGGQEPPAAWPTSGTIEVEDLVIGYADDLPPVLKGLTFSVRNNERIGVVGRTGAGKSSLTLALFRFLEARSGKIFIDGQDISKMDLHSLRSRLAIIPQDPVLFSGTIRSNLDPFDERSDVELRESLARVHLVDSEPSTPVNEPSSTASPSVAPKNTNIFRDLSSGVSESGGNLSQGQRQLLCLARAVVSRPKIMVLDEATSAVDMATDALIQRSIREEFTDSTLIVIAHRLSTIADFDRILVLSEGAVVEFGTPKELWEKEGGVFRDMCEHSGEKEKLIETILRS
ncbi:P-loop containing nucleoside triphosphate hydrolase protein [Stachybotrys elegans]|uniref:P-loop containing nucleoside triphosphate hydrolase protein n=1 Tax=Stachybotrys elegans TaxID=80388 RepID=A0A8K0SSY4_9HYPO|nr:P-loop containing nucleoside triphosphate hydrolase protein [Stachybotrys elegans]